MKILLYVFFIIMVSGNAFATQMRACQATNDGYLFLDWNNYLLKVKPDEFSLADLSVSHSIDYGCPGNPITDYNFSYTTKFWAGESFGSIVLIEFYVVPIRGYSPYTDFLEEERKSMDRLCKPEKVQSRTLYGEKVEICDLNSGSYVSSRRYKFLTYKPTGVAHEILCRVYSNRDFERCEVNYRVLPGLNVRYEFNSLGVWPENYLNLHRYLVGQFDRRIIGKSGNQ